MIYINTEDYHYKFWGYTYKQDLASQGWLVTTYWGKIGMDLETCPHKEFTFDTKWIADDFLERKLREKRNKGYKPLDISYQSLVNGGSRQPINDFEIGLKDLAKKIDLF
jgi:predicted DNA-binding WGR domain protein